MRTLHEAGPELQRTISTDLEVTSKEFFCSLDNISKMMFNKCFKVMFNNISKIMVNNISKMMFYKCSKVMMAAEAMAGADAEEDIHTRF